MTARALGISSPAALSGPGEAAPWPPPRPAHARTSLRAASRVLYGLLGSARDHVQQTGRTTAVAYGGQVDDHGDVTVAPLGVAPHAGGTSRTGAKRATFRRAFLDPSGYLPHGSEARGGIVDPEDLHTVEAVRIV